MNSTPEDLNFDVYQRLKGIASLVDELRLPENALILDVGGYPGTLADILARWKVITLDKPICPRNNYIAGDGLLLPFADRAFELVVSSDTLEHIPAPHRQKFLTEILRVSSHWLVLASPFASSQVNLAEQLLNDLSRVVKHSDNPWLREHQELGLPSLDEVLRELHNAGCSTLSVPNGELVGWFLTMGVQILLECIPAGNTISHQLSQMINLQWKELIFPSTLSYRQIILADKRGKPINLTASVNAERPQVVDSEDIEKKIHTLGRLLIDSAKKIKSEYELSEQQQIPASTIAYIKQLEKVISHQVGELKNLRNEIAQLKSILEKIEGNILIKIWRWIQEKIH